VLPLLLPLLLVRVLLLLLLLLLLQILPTHHIVWEVHACCLCLVSKAVHELAQVGHALVHLSLAVTIACSIRVNSGSKQ
jgi:hypothetical protein